MFLGGLLTAVGFVAIAAKCSPKTLKKVLGYDWMVDLLCTVGILALMSGTGTISGMMIGVTTGLAISAVLFLARKIWGYSKYETTSSGRQWVDHAGQWTMSYLIGKAHRGFNGIPAKIAEAKTAWNQSNVVSINSGSSYA